ncbi:alcohol dehydrogenase catalytic domain-containing protein [Flavobacterium sp. Sd200]|uniref:zinc-dependent alcohol dehydrogenase n=1 Tax=Flavobacterium sp. Sd200 TaxID=2692211 RepID=UPI001370BB74|nr:zinc-dependent alcohol dehydrogenase [Flavobacterium sp. Sd200]MXN93329.1 alcohol dehydrogenase catalytic domain-containing protein [Flavobacterium sp. Sd200]
MKAAVFHKPKDIRVDTVEDPKIEDARDVVLKVTSTAICGSDLHIYNGLFPQPKPLVLGHEFMGIVEEVGSGISNLKVGDRVVVPFPISCGTCHFCNMHLPTHCENSNPEHYGPEGGLLNGKGGGLFGYTDLYGGYSGGQAEYVRVPYADYGPRKVPDNLTDEQVLFLTDIFPTGWSGIDWAGLKGGETVVVWGAGPVGIMAAKSAWLQGAGRVIIVDIQDYRLAKAKQAANVETINYNDGDAVEKIRQMTGGYGADVCVDAVGMEADHGIWTKALNVIQGEVGTMRVLERCLDAVRRGGVVTVLGVYGTPYDNFPVHQWFDKGIQIKGGQAPVHNYIDHLIDLVATGKVVLEDIITHKVPLSDAAKMYDIFNKKEDNCVKVVLKP